MKGLMPESLSRLEKTSSGGIRDEATDQGSTDESSKTSLDCFCTDVHCDVHLMDSTCASLWDADESSTITSMGSSPPGWASAAKGKPRSAKLHSLRQTLDRNQKVQWSTGKDKNTDAGTPDDASEMETMKERFAKLLLGEDLSGGGKGVSSALAISNAITNLSASVFGELYRVEPLSNERKIRWKREIGWLLSVCDHIVEFVPSSQTLEDGSIREVMVTKQRSDLNVNLPALRKLDAMLIDSLDSFTKTEFWYDRATDKDGDTLKRQEEKWWLPTPRVPSEGLSQDARRQLQQQRESINQILKAALAINAHVLSEMEVPKTYWEALPKNGRSILGEGLYREIMSENFSPDIIIATQNFGHEHDVLELVNSVEAAVHIWRRKIQTRQLLTMKDGKAVSKSSWGLSKEAAVDPEKREMLAEKAKSILLLLRHKFPGLPQTILDIHKIQYNKDVGQSILESYSRVLESLSFNILSRIDDVLHADDAARSRLPQSLHKASYTCKSTEVNYSGLMKSVSTHATMPDSQVRLPKNKSVPDFGQWSDKAPSDEAKKSVELLRMSPLRFGQTWSYSGHMNAMQSPPSRD
ncbi:hypothetical protein KP509_04G001800 [Ceratopteris richardii]|nr:hypothetical protein KP509_04G001800 [Ceratopteris richardii]KAH7438111.1 hypothetical protein KP509_04G001800 [Ceratopteris richardii]